MNSAIGGFECVSCLKKAVVQIGNVTTGAGVGYIAIGTPDTVRAERLYRDQKHI
jgi:hypothetical protein